MARRRGMEKYVVQAPQQPAQPQPPQPQPPQPQPPQGESPAPEAKEKVFESERLMLFGPPQTQKTIAILAFAGLVVAALVYGVLLRSRPEATFPWPGFIFTALHGALTGMLLGQLILVYADRIIILFTLMSIFVSETVYGAAMWSALPKFEFTRERFQEILAIFFWAGFVGFWIGFAFYAKRLRDRRRFQQRYSVGQGPNP